MKAREVVDGIDGICVIVCTYDDPIDLTSQCLDSLLCQEKIHEIIVVDSSKRDDIRKLCYKNNKDDKDKNKINKDDKDKNKINKDDKDKNKINYVYTPPKGLSDARNKGMEISKNDIVAFTDSDCIADKNWAVNICNSFSRLDSEKVAIVGGKVLPKWSLANPNKILSNSAIAQGFYSLYDMGKELKEVSQIFGGNFAINKRLINGQIFLSQLGRGKENLLCGEELDFCWRIRKNNLKVVYNPTMIIWHQIPEERIRLKWMWRRMYYSGITRAMIGGKPTPKTVDASYNFYDIIFLTLFILPYLCGIFNGIFKVQFKQIFRLQ